ncbi:RNA-directed DNA polymerase, eukaryota [Tanacetum coccineum]
MKDRWFWSLSGTGEFTAASARQFIDDHLLPEVSSKFSWRKIVPIKVNILAWKIKLNFLPSRLNLSRRGLDIPTIMCPICEKYAESTNHISMIATWCVTYIAKLLLGGMLVLLKFLLMRNGKLGFRALTFLPNVSCLWKVSFILLGGLFGIFETNWCLDLPSLRNRLSSTTLWLVPSNGANIGVDLKKWIEN